MIVCGVDIKAKEAVLAIVESDQEGNFIFRNAETKRLKLDNDRDSKAVKTMFEAIKAIAKKHDISSFVMKSRASRGSMASGGITFKIEGLFQLSDTPVIFVSPQVIAKTKKSNAGKPPETVKIFQQDAYAAAISQIIKL